MSLFVWRVLNKRIPTKDDLSCRGVAIPGTNYCVGGCSNEESISHLFLSCNILDVFGIPFIGGWAYISTATPANVMEQAQQFGGSSVFGKGIRLCLQVIWMTTIWVLWKEHNAMIFVMQSFHWTSYLSALNSILDGGWNRTNLIIFATITHGGPTFCFVMFHFFLPFGCLFNYTFF